MLLVNLYLLLVQYLKLFFLISPCFRFVVVLLTTSITDFSRTVKKLLQHTVRAAASELGGTIRISEIGYRSQRSVVYSNLTFRAALGHGVTGR